jgi:drug/metabolite transporter (DMT)-like permease
MKWLWVFITVAASTVGDLISAKGMVQHGEIQDMSPRGFASMVRYMATQKLVVGGIASNAISFGAFLGLLSMTNLSFAVPVTALSYVVKTFLARIYLGECVTWRRWTGAILVTIGVILISL